VHTYAVGGFYEEGAPLLACADELAGYVAKGFRSVKLKSGAFSLADEVARARAVREAIGPDIQFMLDMNAPYDVDTCIRFAREVAKYDIYWLEEPLHWYLQPSDYVALAKAIPMPLAHGEREWHRFTVRDFIDAGAIRFVQFDCTRYAGFQRGTAHRASCAGEGRAHCAALGRAHSGAHRIGIRRRRVRRGVVG
jgi:L-alanine-DL-glutamate epimerase-like enolase superfamily enzyme